MALECMALPVAHTGGTHSYTYICVCVCVYRGHALKPAELFRRLLYLPHATRGVRSPCNQYGWVGHACMHHRTSKHAHKLAEFLLCAWASHSDKSYGPMDKAPAYGAGDSGFESL